MMDERETEILREPLLDAEDAALLLGIPRSSLYAYAKRGELPYVKIGRHVKFVRGDLERGRSWSAAWASRRLARLGYVEKDSKRPVLALM